MTGVCCTQSTIRGLKRQGNDRGMLHTVHHDRGMLHTVHHQGLKEAGK